MNKNDGLASIELVEHRGIAWVPDPPILVAGENADAFDAQDIIRVLDLAQAAFGVRQRNGCEAAKAAGVPLGKLGRVFVASPRRVARALRIAEPDARRREQTTAVSM